MNAIDHCRRRSPSLAAAYALGLLLLTCSACSWSCASSQESGGTAEAGAVSEELEPPPTPQQRQAAVDAGRAQVGAGVDRARGAALEAYGQWRRDMIAQAMDPEAPLPAPVHQALGAIEFDPHPEALTRDTHYWVSNEYNHHLFRPTIKDHGGIYLGVGTDQNYLLAAWARAPIVIPMDFDEQIRNVHHIYGVIFKRVETPGDFIEQWRSDRSDEVMSWLAEEFGDGQRYAEVRRAFTIARSTIERRLRRTARSYRGRDIPTFLTDQEHYDFIRNLWQQDRVFPTRGDLTADTTMVHIAATLRELELPMGLIYTSNAEQYFSFTPAYRRNMIVQPFDEESLILRTRPMSILGFPEGGDYHYNIQNAQQFARWMEVSAITNSWQLLSRHRQATDIEGLSVISAEPTPSEPAPQVAEIPPLKPQVPAE